MQEHADALRAAGRRLVLVPTMGALHDGHISLVETAKQHGDHVTASIFVNPTQFGPNEDFDSYPRTEEADFARLEAAGVDAVFTPTVASMYPDQINGTLTWVISDRLDEHLCGAYREGHFRGVTTVVTKLFLACKPHGAVFGLKDAQQFLILRRMVQDLNFDVEVIGSATVREPDGLAMSSRNAYMSAPARAQAPVLYEGLSAARKAVEEGEADASRLRQMVIDKIEQADEARIQYVEVVDAGTIQPIETLVPGEEALIALAVFFGPSRLIDNVFLQLPNPP